MIDPTDLVELKDKEPFEPFRINLADGKHYDVTNPDLFVVMETKLFLAFPGGRWTMISFQNITSVDDVPMTA